MKNTYKLSPIMLLAFLLIASGCKKVLVEDPKTTFTTEYFKSQVGLQDAINAMYSGMRFNYGPNGALAVNNVGTDEFTYGDQPRTGQDGDVLTLGTYSITIENGAILTPWNRNFWHINLANAVIEYAPQVGMADVTRNQMVAEARYLRAHYYMLLVSQFGAVPLNLGAGDLQFNDVPYTGFHRNPIATRNELLTANYQAMIDDLVFASQNLPDQRPANAFKLSKAAALHLLSKIYVFRAYSAITPGKTADFQQAYDTAMELINNQARYGVALLQDYGDVHRPGNDYNKEVLFSVERLAQNNTANEVGNPGSDFSGKVNIANNMFNADYTAAVPNSYSSVNSTIAGQTLIDGRPLQYGRPLRRYAPTRWLWETAFADKLNDSRYDNSFRTAWLASSVNAQGTANYNTYVTKIQGLGFAIGDTVIYLAPTEADANAKKALTGAQKKKYWIVAPSQFYTNQNTALNIYPNLKKYDDPNRAAFNDVSGRPFIVSKLSETYLLAAEAAMGLQRNTDAYNLIKVLRERAAYRPGLSSTVLAQRVAANVASIPATITLDFILDERSRELAGESLRWIDLAVRGKLIERAKAFNPDAQNIQAHHVLRPIPLSQLNNVTDPDKAKYQNPGY